MRLAADTARRGRAPLRAAPSAAVLASLALALALAPAARAGARAPTPVSVTIDPRYPSPPVPASFFGLSFELASLPRVASYANRGDLVALLRSLGSGVLRFGGVSADTRVACTDQATPAPGWATSTVQPADLRALAGLAAKTGWRILLTLG